MQPRKTPKPRATASAILYLLFLWVVGVAPLAGCGLSDPSVLGLHGLPSLGGGAGRNRQAVLARIRTAIAIAAADEDTFQPALPGAQNSGEPATASLTPTGDEGPSSCRSLPTQRTHGPGLTPPAKAPSAAGPDLRPDLSDVSITVHSIPGCAACRREKQALQQLPADKQFGAIAFVEYADGYADQRWPIWIRDRRTAGDGFPFTEWRTHARANRAAGWHFHSGFTTLEDLLARIGRTLGTAVSGTARATAGAVSGAASGAIRAPLEGLKYSSRFVRNWTWPGDLRQHLAAEHGLDASQLTDLQCVAMHDALHESHESQGPRRSRRGKSKRTGGG